MVYLSLGQLQKRIDKARKQVAVGGFYYHYKNLVSFIWWRRWGLLEKSEEVYVVYRALYGSGLGWVRPLDDFYGEVKVNRGRMKRFAKIYF